MPAGGLRSRGSWRSCQLLLSTGYKGSRRARRKGLIVAPEARNERREIGALLDRTGGADQPARAVERARLELASEQAMPLVRSGQFQRAGRRAGEAEPPVVRRVADQQHGTMTAAC